MINTIALSQSLAAYTLTFRKLSPDILASLRTKHRDLYRAMCSNGISCVVLSTCLRFEVYIHTEGEDRWNFIEKHLENMLGDYKIYIDKHVGIDAIRYLFEVSSGLHSQIVGEWEILEQVEEALKRSIEFSCSSWLLEKLFRKAVDVGRKVRIQFMGLETHDRGYPQIGIKILSKALGDLNDKRLMFIGSGHAIRRAIRYLMKYYRPSIVVVISEDINKATSICSMYGESCIPLPFSDLIEWLTKIDGIFIAISNLGNEYLSKIRQAVESLKIPVVDISLPPIVKEIHEKIYTFYDIQRYAEEANETTVSCIDKIKKTIDREVEAFLLSIARDMVTNRLASIMKAAEVLAIYSAEKLVKELRISEESREIVVAAFRNYAHKILIPLIDTMLQKSLQNEKYGEYINSILTHFENKLNSLIDSVK
ncbi:MAG: hypothetical protein QXG46_02370 [Ignisphaera sp.]